LSFSPGGNFLVIEAQQGWVDDYLSNKGSSPFRVYIDSPEAVRDDIQRTEIWNLRTGQAIPGYLSSALLEAHFSADEKEFSILCWDRVQQRWDSLTWKRLESIPPPVFWNSLMGLMTAKWLAGNGTASRSVDGRIVVLRVREKSFGFGTIYIWDRNSSQTHKLPGECASTLQPVYLYRLESHGVTYGSGA